MKKLNENVMNKKMNYSCKLILLGWIALISFESSAQAPACTPVVYAFRHAEDFNPNPAPSGGPYGFLTRTGATHADLYPAMIEALRTAKGYCPVTKVYATSSTKYFDENKNRVAEPGVLNIYGAVNSFCTARPLAKSLTTNPQSWQVPKSYPTNNLCVDASTGNVVGALAISSDNTSSDPIMIVDGVGLDEYLTGNNSGPPLHAALLANAKISGSSAIFWTSQGLHALGNAIINGGSQGPLSSNVPVKQNKNLPGRNVVYIFKPKPQDANGDWTGASVTGFSDTSNNYFQCFNFTNTTSGAVGKMQTNNWCGKPNTFGTLLGYVEITPTCTLTRLASNDSVCTNQIPLINLPGGSGGQVGTQINGKICNIKSGNTPAVTVDSSSGSMYVGYCTP